MDDVIILNNRFGRYVEISKDQNNSETLLSRAGTGGGNVPCVLIKCYSICAEESNSMRSDNPHSGIYEAQTCRTLDQKGGNPACKQGGLLICQHLDSYNQALSEKATTLGVNCGMSTGRNLLILKEGEKIEV